MAGMVAGALAFGAEALRAQHQAGPPAPAQAKPVGQMGELIGGGGNSRRAAGPQRAAGRGLEHQHPHTPPPYAAGAGRGRWTCSTQEVALSSSPCNVPFFGPSHPPTPQAHLEPAMLSVDFWEPMEVVEGLVGGPARGDG